ncbi:MAG: DUF5050 domain-containing protein [Clostridiaceae bacterium]|nr:DUF5050 domain-containing protein [Clostridiaceae bacterium]
MRKRSIIFTLLLLSVMISGCSNSNAKESTSEEKITTTSSTATKSTIPFVLNDKTIISCPFIINGTSLIYPNWEDNNKISIIDEPYPTSVLKTIDVKDKFDYSTDTIALINNILYYADGSKSNNLYSINLNDKKVTKLKEHNIHNITPVNNTLYYLDISSEHSNQNRLFSYDTKDNKEKLITKDSVGLFLINGDFILYQNLSDNSSLYSIRTDGTQRQKITDYSVNSFTVYENEILAINTSDNNNLYRINPSDLTSDRIGIINGENLKSFNDKIYYINLDKSNSLYELKVDLSNKKISGSQVNSSSINDYYPTDAGIFIKKSPDVLTPYIIKTADK